MAIGEGFEPPGRIQAGTADFKSAPLWPLGQPTVLKIQQPLLISSDTVFLDAPQHQIFDDPTFYMPYIGQRQSLLLALVLLTFNLSTEQVRPSIMIDLVYMVDKVGVGPTSPGGFMPAFHNATCPYDPVRLPDTD